MSSSVYALPVAGQPVRHGDRLPVDGRRRVALRCFVGDEENPLLESVAAGRTVFSPLVLYGRSGVGKTHLAVGLAQAWKTQHPDERVAYVTGADWVRRYPAQELAADGRSAATGPTAAARWSPVRWSAAGMLVVDDVDHLRESAAAQYALSRRLDDAAAENTQVIVTAKVHPAAIAEFSAGLRSRLVGGLAVAVQAPGIAARTMIVHELAAVRGTTLPPDSLMEVARRPATVPELLGRMHRLDVAARLHDGPPDARFVERVLALDGTANPLSLRDIAAATARHFGIRMEELLAARRRKALVTARGVFALLARELLGTSYAQLGRFLGGRDHSTVMHSCQQIATSMRDDPCIAAAVSELRSSLTAGAS